MNVLITGASGVGTSTLGRRLAGRLGYSWLESDDYLWLPTEPPYTTHRDLDSRAALLGEALAEPGGHVVAGSIMGWGLALEDGFDLIVFLSLDRRTRMQRLHRRESERYGRPDPAFMAWAGAYDDGTEPGRSRARHDAWLAERSAPVVRMTTELSADSLVEQLLVRAPVLRPLR